jgi:hypothetical protein
MNGEGGPDSVGHCSHGQVGSANCVARGMDSLDAGSERRELLGLATRPAMDQLPALERSEASYEIHPS